MEVGEITPPSSSGTSITTTPQSCCSFDEYYTGVNFGLDSPPAGGDDLTSLFEIEKHEALRELQQMVNRYNECFRLLKDTLVDVELLREENFELKAEHLELQFLVDDMEKEETEKAAATEFLLAGVRSLKFEDNGGKGIGGGRKWSDLDSPGGFGSGSGSGYGSGVESGSGSGLGSDGARGGGGGGVPKSISIRSRGFLEVNQPPDGGTHRIRLPASPALHGGENKESGEVEVEVYNQGTMKTELCNKWGEMGWCPYSDRCQFAHGMEELRPVIRHPRYKTQLCRMMGTGGDCPYGHRCHFRHALPETPN